ncbi:hypothetical protein McanMca71_004909 [Microsporum canis]|uniref:Uncharacterized protein n=1 Tax=Arthroderma otae (strain ATCC MYA-4605 / CBS 113480) TaxID=554155 RepID=C5FZA3_ARTOC|nr:uncharacterized protein MCYG_08025 [Microsporum canis CBS 113480]EEQ35206.1 predicted protein [Microsporum canis CBS 113480]
MAKKKSAKYGYYKQAAGQTTEAFRAGQDQLLGPTSSLSPEEWLKYNFRVYSVAKEYGISDLEVDAKTHIESCYRSVPLTTLLELTKGQMDLFKYDKLWICKNMAIALDKAYQDDRLIFSNEEFLSHIGNSPEFDRLMIQAMGQNYMANTGDTGDNDSYADGWAALGA